MHNVAAQCQGELRQVRLCIDSLLRDHRTTHDKLELNCEDSPLQQAFAATYRWRLFKVDIIVRGVGMCHAYTLSYLEAGDILYRA